MTADTFSAYRDLLRSYLLADGAEITYEPERANRFVFSGYLADGRIFDDKTVIVPGCPVSANVHIAFLRRTAEPKPRENSQVHSLIHRYGILYILTS